MPKKTLPTLRTDEEAEEFVARADLSEYNLGRMVPVRFEFAQKDARINMRLPSALLEAVKAHAARQGIPYQRFVRDALERAIAGE